MNGKQWTKSGLTLAEMAVVLAVVVILAAMVISVVSRVDNQAKEKATAALFAIIESALQEYYDYNDVFPIQPDVEDANIPVHSQILYGALYSMPASRKILQQIDDELIRDEFVDVLPTEPARYEIYDLWGTVVDYVYDAPDDTFPLLRSAGPDRSFGTPDDITNE